MKLQEKDEVNSKDEKADEHVTRSASPKVANLLRHN